MSSSLKALASRAQQTVVDSLESIPAEYAQTMFVATGFIAAFVGFASGYQPVVDICSNYLSGMPESKMETTFQEYVKDVFTLTPGREAVTGAGLYAATTSAIAYYGAAFSSDVNKLINKFLPELYEARVNKAAERLIEVMNTKSLDDIEAIADSLEDTSLNRYLLGLDSPNDVSAIFQTANKMLSNLDNDLSESEEEIAEPLGIRK